MEYVFPWGFRQCCGAGPILIGLLRAFKIPPALQQWFKGKDVSELQKGSVSFDMTHT